MIHRTTIRYAAGLRVEVQARVYTSAAAAVDAVPVAVVPAAVGDVPVAGTAVVAVPSD